MLGSRDRMRKRVEKFLEPGEEVQQVFPVEIGGAHV